MLADTETVHQFQDMDMGEFKPQSMELQTINATAKQERQFSEREF